MDKKFGKLIKENLQINTATPDNKPYPMTPPKPANKPKPKK